MTFLIVVISQPDLVDEAGGAGAVELIVNARKRGGPFSSATPSRAGSTIPQRAVRQRLADAVHTDEVLVCRLQTPPNPLWRREGTTTYWSQALVLVRVPGARFPRTYQNLGLGIRCY